MTSKRTSLIYIHLTSVQYISQSPVGARIWRRSPPKFYKFNIDSHVCEPNSELHNPIRNWEDQSRQSSPLVQVCEGFQTEAALLGPRQADHRGRAASQDPLVQPEHEDNIGEVFNGKVSTVRLEHFNVLIQYKISLSLTSGAFEQEENQRRKLCWALLWLKEQ